MSTKDVKPKAKGQAPVTIPVAPEPGSIKNSKGLAPFTPPKKSE